MQQNRSAIGTALPLIKLRDNGPIKNIWEEQTLCRGMFGQAKASFLVSNPREQRICTIGEAFRVLKSRIFQVRPRPESEWVTMDTPHLRSRRTNSSLQYSADFKPSSKCSDERELGLL